MFKKISLVILFSAFLTSCSSIKEIIPEINDKFTKTFEKTPNDVKEVVASRVDPRNELFYISSANISRSGGIIAQAKANKEANKELQILIKKNVELYFSSYMLGMDSYSKGMLKEAKADLVNYATDLSLKTAKQKGAWEIEGKVYSVLVVEKNKINAITQKIIKDFLVPNQKNNAGF